MSFFFPLLLLPLQWAVGGARAAAEAHARRTREAAVVIGEDFAKLRLEHDSERGLAPPSPRGAAGYSVSACLTPGTASKHAAPR